MRFTINKNVLTENLNSTANATVTLIALSSPLEGVLLTVKDNIATFVGYDGDLGIRIKCKVKNAENGSIIIREPKIMAKITSKLQEDILFQVIKSKDGSNVIKLSSGKSVIHLPCQAAENYPNITEFNKEKTFSIPGKTLKNILKQINHAVAAHGENPELADIRIEYKPELKKLYFVGADSARLAFRFIPKEEIPEIFKLAVTVPEHIVLELIDKLPEDKNSKINIILDGNHILFEKDTGDLEIFSHLIDSRNYLDYLKLADFRHEKIIAINTNTIKNILNRLMPLLSDEISSYVILKFSKNDANVELSCKTTIGSFQEKMKIKTIEGEFLNNFKIAFNPKFIYNAVCSLNCENFYLYIKNKVSPVKFKPVENFDEDFTFLVMPIRLQQKNK